MSLPEEYDDQIKNIYQKLDDFSEAIKEFTEASRDMGVFRDLRVPMSLLGVCPIVARQTLEDFCTAVRLVLNSTEII